MPLKSFSKGKNKSSGDATAAALDRAKEVIARGGTQVEAATAAKEAVREALKARAKEQRRRQGGSAAVVPCSPPTAAGGNVSAFAAIMGPGSRGEVASGDGNSLTSVAATTGLGLEKTTSVASRGGNSSTSVAATVGLGSRRQQKKSNSHSPFAAAQAPSAAAAHVPQAVWVESKTLSPTSNIVPQVEDRGGRGGGWFSWLLGGGGPMVPDGSICGTDVSSISSGPSRGNNGGGIGPMQRVGVVGGAGPSPSLGTGPGAAEAAGDLVGVDVDGRRYLVSRKELIKTKAMAAAGDDAANGGVGRVISFANSLDYDDSSLVIPGR